MKTFVLAILAIFIFCTQAFATTANSPHTVRFAHFSQDPLTGIVHVQRCEIQSTTRAPIDSRVCRHYAYMTHNQLQRLIVRLNQITQNQRRATYALIAGGAVVGAGAAFIGGGVLFVAASAFSTPQLIGAIGVLTATAAGGVAAGAAGYGVANMVYADHNDLSQISFDLASRLGTGENVIIHDASPAADRIFNLINSIKDTSARVRVIDLR